MDITMDPNLKCSVFGCHTRPNQGLRFYRFPCHNPQICSIWEQRIYQSANIDFNIVKDLVCELHFDYRCKTGNECVLKEGSLPTLNLPCFDILFSRGNEHFHMSANRIEEPSYTISVESVSDHCRFCLRRGLLYEVESSTYRSKSFLSLIELPTNVLPENIQPNACLSCLKSIVIAHQLSMAVEHSNKIVQQLLLHPIQNKVVSNTNYIDIKSELAFCNLIPAGSRSIKLEIEIEDKMVWANEDYEQKLVGIGRHTSLVAYVNTQNIDEKSICVAEKLANVSKMRNSVTSDEQCPKEFQKSFAIGGEYTTDFSAEGFTDASENSDSCVLLENTDDNAEAMVSNISDDSCMERLQFGSEQAPESANTANDPSCKYDLCKFTTDYKATLTIHKNLHLAGQTIFTTVDKTTHWNDNDSVYVCPICEWKTSSPDSFNANMCKHVQSDKNIAIGSQELETLETDLVRNADCRYQCGECPKAFVKKHNFIQHKKIHTNENSHKCTECLNTYNYKSSLNAHKRIHTNERPYKCTECPKTFRYKRNLIGHKRIHANERPYKCSECPKGFSQKRNLDIHTIIHTNERPYKCAECPKGFSQQRNLDIHTIIHTNERPYKCNDCPKTFRFKSGCDRHKKTHTNERPYKCTECPKTFRQIDGYKIHKRIHTNERPYKCSDCSKTFSDGSVLRRHKKTHTNDKPYKCTDCPKTFSDRGVLRRHKRTHTNERPYKCSECPKAFSDKSNFSVHRRIHTNKSPRI